MPSNIERKARRKRQTRLTFEPTGSSSPAPSRMTPAKVRFERAKSKQTEPSPHVAEDEEQDSNDEILASGQKETLSLGATKARGKRNIAKKLFSTLPTPRKSLRRPGLIVVSSDSEEEDKDPVFSSPKRSQVPLHKQVEHASDSDEVVRSLPPKRRRPMKSIMSDDDELPLPVASPLKRARNVTESDDSDAVLPSPLKRQRVVPVPEASEEEDSREEEEHPTEADLARRRKDKGKGRARSETPDVPTSSARTTRQQTRRHRTEKEKQLELLRRRRAGESIEELTESESESDDDQDGDFQKLDVFDDEEEEEDLAFNRNAQVKAKVRRQRGDSSDEEAGDSDFVIEDDEAPLGVPDYSMDIPLEFTHAAHKSHKAHFKDVIEWMVQNKLNPGFSRDDPVYRQGFSKLDSEYLGYADSKFVSTQWTTEFTRAVYARPMIQVTKLRPGEGADVLGEAKCEACNHRNHQPTYALQFTGKAYRKSTLEEIDDDSDSEEEEDEEEDSEDSDKASVNSKGFALPSQDKIWFSGNVCAQNAQQAHTLIHWRWHLNDWVVSKLEEEGHLQPAKLAEREKMTTRKRMKLANKVVDRWGEENKIKTLYRDFKSQLETARELKAKTRGGWQ